MMVTPGLSKLPLKTIGPWLILLILLAFSPALVSLPIAVDVLIFGLLALSFNLMFGYIGLLSFGHAAYFGLGAYSAGLILKYSHIPLSVSWVVIPIGSLVAALGALCIGAIVVRRTIAYFALGTLAFGQVLYYIILQLRDTTGGSDGLYGIPRPLIGGIFSGPIKLSSLQFFYVIFFVFVIAVVIMRIILNSSFGRSAVAVRENEERARFLGYNCYTIKLTMFTISGFFCGLAGTLYVVFNAYVGVDSVSWYLSGEIVFMSLLGGTGVFWGPLVGAFVYIMLKWWVSAYVYHWPLVVGALFAVIVLWFREGILGTTLYLWRRRFGT
jgi:branched-chain amino acid transport system permease protein